MPTTSGRGDRRGLLVALTVAALLNAVWAAAAESRMADAAMRRDRAAVQSLIRQRADVNAPQGDGMTALHWAALHRDAELARVLIRAGAAVGAATRLNGHTPLLVAAANGDAAMARLIIEGGASASAATANGTTPLMLAAGSGDADLVGLLLDRGADPNAAEVARRETALMFAAAANRAEAIRMLVRRGADPRPTTRVVDLSKDFAPKPALNADRQDVNRQLVGTQGGLTALMFAARQGHLDAVLALLDGGADVNQVSAGDRTSPLLIATLNGHFDLATRLLERDADPRLANAAGATPLYAAINIQWIPRAAYPQPTSQGQQQTTYLALMTAMLARGADPNVRLAKKLWFTGYNFDLSGVDETGATPFWRAAQSTDVEAMRLLVEWGGDPTMSSAATERRRVSVAARPGGEPAPAARPSSESGVNAFQVAAGDGWFGNFNVNAPGGWMPSIRYLVEELGFDVNASDYKGYTALHFAAARGDNEMILYLVSKGANVTAVSGDGVSTADMANGHDARIQPYPETIALLEKLGSKNNHKCLSCGRSTK